MLLEREGLAAQGSPFEVEDALRVEGLTHITGLEMQMRPCGTTRRTAITDEFASADDIAAFDNETRQVAILSFQTIQMPDDQHITITSRHIRFHGHTHHAIEGGINSVTHVHPDVDTLVRTSLPELEA